MDNQADFDYAPGPIDYSISWALLLLFGVFGVHRFYQGKVLTGIIYLLTGGLFLIGFVYDMLTLNEQISDRHHNVDYFPAPAF